MKFWLVLFCAVLTVSCTKSSDATKVEAERTAAEKVEITNVKTSVEKPLFSKVFRESIYFAASLEREALKLLLKDNSLQKSTLFSVLSYAIETKSGSRKSTPLGLDCGKFEIKQDKNFYSVQKACQNPHREAVLINALSEDKDYEIRFMIPQWGSVLGMSAVLTGSDVKCKMHIIDQKLNSLVCENWTYQVTEDQLSATVIKLDEFTFLRNADQQFHLKGGFYKELVQNKKIDILVPLEGKIKIIEKEIKVIDDFQAQKDGVMNGQIKEKVEIKPVEEKKKPSGQEIENQNQSETQNQSQGEVQSQGQSETQTQGTDPGSQADPNGSPTNPQTTGGQSGRRGR
ncbi:MAG: hypothetical protein ACXWQQ_10705 [Pseudobdellovibrio sp.]